MDPIISQFNRTPIFSPEYKSNQFSNYVNVNSPGHMSIPAVPALNLLSQGFCLWVKVQPGNYSGATIIHGFLSANNFIKIVVTGNKYVITQVKAGVTITTFSSVANVNFGVWECIYIAWDSLGINFALNGSIDTAIAGDKRMISGSYAITMGRDSSSLNPISANIYNFRYLSPGGDANDIKTLYNQNWDVSGLENAFWSIRTNMGPLESGSGFPAIQYVGTVGVSTDIPFKYPAMPRGLKYSLVGTLDNSTISVGFGSSPSYNKQNGHVSLWFKHRNNPASISTTKTLFDLSDGGTNRISLSYNGSLFTLTRVRSFVVMPTLTLAIQLNNNVWNHICISWSFANGIFWYVNGAIVQFNISTSNLPWVSNPTFGIFNSAVPSASNSFDGSITQVSIGSDFDAGDSQRVEDMMNYYLYGRITPEIDALWNFTDGSGNVSLSSGSGNNGVVSNGVWNSDRPSN